MISLVERGDISAYARTSLIQKKLSWSTMENIVGGMAALSKSAVGLIWLGRRVE